MNQTTSIAVSIFIGFLLVAGALYFSMQSPISVAQASVTRDADSRHVYGNTDAEITIIEFSDIECPFCSRVHPTIERIVDESDGKINWEYRHLPLAFHATAEEAAVVSECVAKHQGNDAFWQYLDTVFKNQALVSSSYVADVAQDLGVTADQLTACYEDPAIKSLIATDAAAAASVGGSGTPYSVIAFPDGTLRPVNGALPYEQWIPLLER